MLFSIHATPRRREPEVRQCTNASEIAPQGAQANPPVTPIATSRTPEQAYHYHPYRTLGSNFSSGLQQPSPEPPFPHPPSYHHGSGGEGDRDQERNPEDRVLLVDIQEHISTE